MPSNPIVTIKAGREKPILNQHPWIFSGAITSVKEANPGDVVTVLDAKGNFLGRGYFNPKSQIQVRLLTWQDEPIDDNWWRKMLQRAIDSRNNEPEEGGYRIINAENDFIPGLVADYYNGWIVIQALTLFIDQQKQYIANLLMEMTGARGVYERSDVDVRGREGLNDQTGSLAGLPPPDHIEIQLSPGLKVWVDVKNGHKTGFYLDQRQNHLLPDEIITTVRDGAQSVLNCFAYTGAFTLSALAAGGTHVVSVDSSMEALQLAEKNITLNGLDQQTHGETYDLVQANCFDYLREAVENGDQYDMVILDPPKFAHNKQQIDRAARGYKDLNLHAFQVIKPGGYLMTFSCSGAISRDLFQKIVFGALADTGRQAQVIRHLGPNDDHPVALTFPEGDYLKGLLLRVY